MISEQVQIAEHSLTVLYTVAALEPLRRGLEFKACVVFKVSLRKERERWGWGVCTKNSAYKQHF